MHQLSVYPVPGKPAWSCGSIRLDAWAGSSVWRRLGIAASAYQTMYQAFHIGHSTRIDVEAPKESQMDVLTSGMDFLQKSLQTVAIAALSAVISGPFCAAQNPAPSQPPTILDRLNAMMAGGKSAWTPEQVAVMERLRDAAVKDPYALRELGDKPEVTAAWEVLGAVTEVPMKSAYDTLAAYQDGSARYLNFSGSSIFWDKPDEIINRMCQTMLNSSAQAGARAKPRLSLLLPKSGIQVTLLTRSGIYAISDPPEPVVKAAASLMRELIRRVNSSREQTDPTTK